jgi:hypothetical protein
VLNQTRMTFRQTLLLADSQPPYIGLGSSLFEI